MTIKTTTAVVLAEIALLAGLAQAVPPSNVPPTMEIEVLDPGVDPEGNPAVQLKTGEDGQTVVDIPPTVLVHRYYYTGDRSFQAQMLRGGPVIIVANHPKTGERCYVEAQLPPGAPRVTYKCNTIIYDYDHHAAMVHFGLFGAPTVKYRNGRTWAQTAAKVVHWEKCKDHTVALAECSKSAAVRASTTAAGTIVVAGSAAKGVVSPVTRLVANLPVIRNFVGGDFERQMATRLAEHKRDHSVKALERERERREWTISTNRK